MTLGVNSETPSKTFCLCAFVLPSRWVFPALTRAPPVVCALSLSLSHAVWSKVCHWARLRMPSISIIVDQKYWGRDPVSIIEVFRNYAISHRCVLSARRQRCMKKYLAEWWKPMEVCIRLVLNFGVVWRMGPLFFLLRYYRKFVLYGEKSLEAVQHSRAPGRFQASCDAFLSFCF